MPAVLGVQSELHVGVETLIEAPSPGSSFCVVFEDDGETGYLYGLDLSRDGNPILDALHIYNVAQVSDRAIPSAVKLLWSTDGLKAALTINGFIHAVFDFQAQRGYCRSGFPPSSSFSAQGHAWSDDALQLFA